MRRTSFLAGLLLLTLVWSSQADEIVLKDGTRISGAKITRETLGEVRYTTRSGSAASVKPSTRIKAILRDDLPESYENGERYLRSGDYRSAVAEFQAVAGSAGGNLWLAEYSYFNLGHAHRLQGIRRNDKNSLGEAVAAYDKVIESNANSRFLFDVHIYRGLCYRVLKQFQAATGAYESAGAGASANGLGGEYGSQASLGVAWCKLESGDHTGAQAGFNGIASGSSADSAIHREAMAGWCEAMVAGGNAAGVKTKMQGLLASAKGGGQLAMVHNGLGVALFGEKKYAMARAHFVQVVAAYFTDPNEHARALYYAGRCFAALKEDAKYQSVYWKELKSRYPASTWAVRVGS